MKNTPKHAAPRHSSRKPLVTAAAVASLAFGSLLASAPAQAASSDIVPTSSSARAGHSQQLLDLINSHRAAKGLKPVKYSATLSGIAQGQSDRLVKDEAVNHTDHFMTDRRATGWDAVGEIHALSYRVSVPDLMGFWKGSSGHNKVLTDPKMDVIGIGLTYADGSLARTKQPWKLVGTVASYGYPSGAGPADASTRVTGSAPAPVSTVAAGPFRDVASTHTFAREITWVRDAGILRGWSDGTYRPNSQVTREQTAAAMYRIAGSPAYTPPRRSPFKDVPTSHVFYKEISWMHAKGISTGWRGADGTRTYKPTQVISRDHMAAFLYRAAGSPAYTAPRVSPFVDVPTSRGFYKQMAWMKATGISKGWSDGTYRPGATTQRYAMAAFLYRFDRAF